MHIIENHKKDCRKSPCNICKYFKIELGKTNDIKLIERKAEDMG